MVRLREVALRSAFGDACTSKAGKIPRERGTAVARSCRRRKRHYEARFVTTALGVRFRMPTLNNRVLMLTAGILFATSACGGNATVPNSFAPPVVVNDDSTSILKKLTKDVEIGSTVDPKNGDTGPRAISLVRSTFGLTKGQLLVCNFENSAGAAGKGTTIEVLNPKPHSAPATFTQNAKVEGCDGDAITEANQVYGTGKFSGRVSQFDQGGVLKKSFSAYLKAPLSDGDAFCGEPYAPEDIYVSDAETGAVVKVAFTSVTGKTTLTEVMSGFAVNKTPGWSALGPSGIQYNSTKKTGSLCTDTLYVVDGVDNTIVSVSNASNLVKKDEIVVQPGGKTFKCTDPKLT